MLYLIRQTRLTGDKVLDQNDAQLDVQNISVGSGEGQQIQMAGAEIAPAHVKLTAINNGEVKFECTKGQQVTLDGEPAKKGSLVPGQVLSVGRHNIKIMSAPAGFACALEFLINADVAHSAKQRFQTNLNNVGSNRKIAYILSILVLVFCLLIPLIAMFDSDVKKQLSDLGIWTDSHWSSGPLIPAHRIPAIGDDCTSCHQTPFEVVQDKSCLGCHSGVEQHVHSKHASLKAFEDYRCGSCHKEHNEPATIIVQDQSLCVDCHGDLASLGVDVSKSNVAKVSGFNAELHPEFRLGLLNFDGFKWQEERTEYSEALTENSNLKFPHDMHLDVEQVQALDSGDALMCNSCHELSADREHFEPITMEGSCRECHGLGFDEFDPSRQLPHGSPLLVQQTMEEYYIRMYADPDSGVDGIDHVRRVPGKRRDLAKCKKGPLECGRERAAIELENQFAKTGCITCHEVEKMKIKPLKGQKNSTTNWLVKSVKLNNDWFSQGRFDHASHLNLRDASEQEICSDCHKALDSDTSADILIPGRKNCLECHDDTADHAVELNCVACHSYHVTGNQAIWLKQIPKVLEQVKP